MRRILTPCGGEGLTATTWRLSALSMRRDRSVKRTIDLSVCRVAAQPWHITEIDLLRVFVMTTGWQKETHTHTPPPPPPPPPPNVFSRRLRANQATATALIPTLNPGVYRPTRRLSAFLLP
ncbi:unnamed protein product [Laminaria digitata]